jgi:diaminopimelate decarboxylase
MTAPFTLLAEAVRQHGSPLWAYDASTIAERVEQLNVFDTVRFAQKANPNLHVLRLMRAHGLVLDAVSLGEMERAFAAGASVDGDPAGVVLTCDALDRPTLERVVASKIEVNAGSIDMLRQLGERSPGHRVWIRINPGFGHGHSRKTNTGGEISKHGTKSWTRRWRASRLMACTWWACTCTLVPGWTTSTWNRWPAR